MLSVEQLSKLTVKSIKEYAKEHNVKPPSGLVKSDLVRYVYGYLDEMSKGLMRDTKKQYIQYKELIPVYADPNLDWLEHLHLEGWAVVPIESWNAEYTNMFLDWFSSCSDNFDKENIDTWIPENLPVMNHGILKNYFGQTELQWKIREDVVGIFSRIWNVAPEDLLCSFDGGCLIPASGISVDTKFKQWVHVDQHRDDTKMSCVQGIVNFVDNGPEDGGLVLLRRSKDIFNEYMEKHPSYGLNWKFADIEDEILSNLDFLKICAPAGSIILFDSRMFHCNTAPTGPNKKADGTPRFRMCTYVSMLPRNGANNKELQKRITLYEKGRMTSHWCYGKFFKETPEHPNTYGKPYNKPRTIEIAHLNQLRRRLVGY